ncbi:hypothetical protein I7I51_07408 [Histoplasma capsulatum]|uniref:Uncharacterized protein n=1 Tax=Ajellomyces capsulatus TaxID=5037 RepID=A0A8A1LVP4_AJECA|nr:hypothetical protein I7I51_07408 [Histoplasma capsulatum]
MHISAPCDAQYGDTSSSFLLMETEFSAGPSIDPVYRDKDKDEERRLFRNRLGGFLCTQARPAVFNDLAASCDPTHKCADLGGSCVEDVFYIVASAHLATQIAAKKQNGKLRLKYRCYTIHLPGALVSHPCYLQPKPTPALDRRCADYSSNATSRNIIGLDPDRD